MDFIAREHFGVGLGAAILIAMHKSGTRFILALVGLWALLYGSFSLTRPPLLDDADSVHAEVAREIFTATTGPRCTPTAFAISKKLRCCTGAWQPASRLFGVADWSARLPLALYTLCLILAAFSLGRRLFGSDAAGFYSALILLTSFGVFIFTRILIPDVIVCLWMTAAMLFFWRSLEEGEQPSRTSAYALPRRAR